MNILDYLYDKWRYYKYIKFLKKQEDLMEQLMKDSSKFETLGDRLVPFNNFIQLDFSNFKGKDNG